MPAHSAASPAVPLPKVSVVVCTHNRADRLARCLTSLVHQSLPASDFEVVVVDDGSTDATAATCEPFRSPQCTIIRQANQGLGAARERGWRCARAPLIAFLDDDAEAPPGWLEAILPRFANPQAAPAVLGGPTRALWGAPRPAWLDDSLAVWLTVWAPYENFRESAQEQLFVGANMTFQRSALDQVGGFSPELGRRGDALLSHEESELWSRMRAAGLRTAYDPAAWVHHFVPSARLERSWFRRRIFWEGVSVTRRSRGQREPARWLRAARLAGSSLVSEPVRHHVIHPSQWGRSITWQLHIAYSLGCAREWLRTT